MKNKLTQIVTTYTWLRFTKADTYSSKGDAISSSETASYYYSSSLTSTGALSNKSSFTFRYSTTQSEANVLKNKFMSFNSSTAVYAVFDDVTISKSGSYNTSYFRAYSISGPETLTTTDPTQYTAGWDGNYYYQFSGTTSAETDVVTDSNIFGGINYKHIINTDDNLEVGTVAAAEISFTTSLATLTTGQELNYKVIQRNDNDTWRQVGKFYVYSVEKKDNRYAVKAYDAISKFDTIVDSWLATQFPDETTSKTMMELFTTLCTFCGATGDSTAFTNSTFACKKHFTATNLKGRTVLQYIAQVAGGYCKANASGVIGFYHFDGATHTITNSQYISRTIDNYSSPVIQKVKIAASDDSEGVIKPDSPAGDSTLFISGNAFLAIITGETLSPSIADVAQNIFDIVDDYSYTPVTINLYEDYGIEAGDIVSIDGKTAYIFSKEMTASGVVLTSTSDKNRDSHASADSELVNLKGEFNIIKNTVNSHTQTIGEQGAQIDDLDYDMNNNSGKVSQISQTASEIQAKVKDSTGYTVLTMNSGSVQIGNQSGAITIQGSQINADTLNLTGKIVFDDFDTTDPDTLEWLEHSGNIYRQSTKPTLTSSDTGALWLNTGNDITEGSITYYADCWYSWTGTAFTQVSNPYYIKSTYIDSTTIKSPTITGNQVIVNSDYGGAFKLQLAGVTKGFIGYGKYQSGTNCVIVTNDTQGDGVVNPQEDYYLAITDGTDARIQAGYSYIKVTSTGCYVCNNGGSEIPLGYAVFA